MILYRNDTPFSGIFTATFSAFYTQKLSWSKTSFSSGKISICRRVVFIKKIREWFSDVSRNDGKKLEEFSNAFLEKIEQIFGDYLWNTISIRDTAAAKEKKENFYYGILLGLLGYKATWLTKSNAESGTGYSDILVEVPDNRTGIVIELKYA